MAILANRRLSPLTYGLPGQRLQQRCCPQHTSSERFTSTPPFLSQAPYKRDSPVQGVVRACLDGSAPALPPRRQKARAGTYMPGCVRCSTFSKSGKVAGKSWSAHSREVAPTRDQALKPILATLKCRDGPSPHGSGPVSPSYAIQTPEWRNWQTRQVEGLVPVTGSAGSIPVSGNLSV
jgi:hypothetical protein